jgi:hypothetical protein
MTLSAGILQAVILAFAHWGQLNDMFFFTQSRKVCKGSLAAYALFFAALREKKSPAISKR